MEELIEKAKEGRLNASVPYSEFYVGAALKTKSGKIYTGCNVENHGIQSICAERTAFVKAISEGEREFECILVLAGQEKNGELEFCTPCGYCRQFMSEYVDKDFKVYAYYGEGNVDTFTIEDLLPHSFELEE